jgi:hypothetical protein
MKPSFKIPSIWLCFTLACATCLPAHGAFVTNGGFEAGFAGWTRVDQLGSEGTFSLQTGTLSPVNAQPVPAPPEGTTAAMTDAAGPGSHVLFQNFIVTLPVSTTLLSFDLFIGNRDTAFFTPNTLDFATPTLNQQARVDILAGGSDPFSVSAVDVLLNVFQTQPGDPLVSGYTHLSIDVTALLNSHLNSPLRLRFAEVDNVNIFQLGVDNVSLDASPTLVVPEPSSYVLTIAALLGIGWARRRCAALI